MLCMCCYDVMLVLYVVCGVVEMAVERLAK